MISKSYLNFNQIDDILSHPPYLREYSNDIPSQPQPHLVKRVMLAAIPFFTLHPFLRTPISMGVGLLRIWNTPNHFHRCIAIISLAAAIFQHSSGMILTTIQDIIMEAISLKSKDSWEECFKSLVKITNHLIFLTLISCGGLELTILSFAMQAAVNLMNSKEEFKNGRWIEGCAELLMAGIRMKQTHLQFKQLQKNGEIEMLAKKIMLLPRSQAIAEKTNPTQKLDGGYSIQVPNGWKIEPFYYNQEITNDRGWIIGHEQRIAWFAKNEDSRRLFVYTAAPTGHDLRAGNGEIWYTGVGRLIENFQTAFANFISFEFHGVNSRGEMAFRARANEGYGIYEDTCRPVDKDPELAFWNEGRVTYGESGSYQYKVWEDQKQSRFFHYLLSITFDSQSYWDEKSQSFFQTVTEKYLTSDIKNQTHS